MTQDFQRLMIDVTLQIASATDDEFAGTLDGVLGRVGALSGADRAYVVEFNHDQTMLRCTYEWCAPGIEAQIDYVHFPATDFPWSVGLLLDRQQVHITDIEALPDEAAAERASFGLYGVRSLLQVPMIAGEHAIGVVGFNSVGGEMVWPESMIDVLQSVANAAGAAIVRQRTADELVKARRFAEEANAAKTTFLSRMSHELRTPLNAVLGFTELMMLEESRSAQDITALQQVHTSGEHLLALVEDVLDISRIEAGKMSMSVEPVEVEPVLNAALDMIRSAGLDTGLTLTADSVPAGAAVVGDRQRLQQVIVNLVSNACKYNRPQGSVHVGLGWRDQITEITVSDTGIGIPAADMDRIFEPFDRLGREQSSVEGTGIGLTLTKMIVELMGGTIALESIEGAGTTVRFTLPSIRTAAPPGVAPKVATGHERSVLCVEDNEASLLLLRRVVEGEHDLAFTAATTVAGALDSLARDCPALVLLDLHLADGSGEDLLAKMRTHPDWKAVPVVVVTADVDPTVVQRVIAAGAIDFLPKPVSIVQLREVIRRLLPTPAAH